MANSKETDSKKYPKRVGTSGIRGPLYETKLLSLIYFRAIHNDNIEEIYLATNVDKVGSFDDICLRVKLKGIKKPMTVFIQAKHRENSNTVFTLSKSDLVDYFNSYLEIRSKFKPNADDVLFNGELDETECLFVIYTTAKGDKKSKKYEGSFADHLDALIGTGDPGTQPSHDAEHVDLLCDIVLEEQMTALARLMVKCVYGEFSHNAMLMLMKNELLIKYHVILAQKVFDVADIEPEGHRNASFRKDFFQIDGKYLRIFKDELCTEILKRRNRDNPTESNNLLESLILLHNITDLEALYKEVGSRFIYKNGKFVLLDKSSQAAYYGMFLDKINESQENILKTVELAVKECFTQLSQKSIAGQKPDSVTADFSTLKFKVPASFGNKDLSIKGSDVKVERKLNDIHSKIVSFIEKAKPNNIITIDDSLGEGFLQLSGGIASAVGNLLVSDESSQLLKFNDDETLLGNLGKKLYCKLKEKYPITDLAQYKFEVQAKVFPKLSITTDEYTRKVVSDFLGTLIFYTSQYNEKKVEETLKYEINITQNDEVKHVEVTSNAIFLKYHDAMQKWSMTTEAGKGTYLEKEGSLYKKAAILGRYEPMISVINMMQRIKNKNYDFREETVNIKLDDLVSGTIIVTDNKKLTLAKLTKQLNNRDSAVLDFEYIINLSLQEDKALRTELMDSKEVKTLIVVYDSTLIDISSNRKLLNVASSMKNQKVIIITDQKSVEKAKEIFSTGKVIKDEKNRLIDMTKETRDSILANTKVIFQGVEVTLGEILFNNSIEDVSGYVLYKMMHSNQNCIGKPIINLDFKPKLYVQRSVRQYFRDKFQAEKSEAAGSSRSMSGGAKRVPGYVTYGRRYLTSLNDLPPKVLLIGDPGIGKSTLLTQLTLKTKESWSKPGWIVRVNLLEHTKQFSEWKVDKTEIGALQCFRFLCQAALSKESDTLSRINITLVESNNTIYVKDFKGDEWTLFELKNFLNFYNSTETLIVLFDGFDEICPNYEDEVLMLMRAVKYFCRNHKVLVTSRPYYMKYNLLELLQFDTIFEIKPLKGREQHFYLTTLWDEQKILKNLDEGHLKNIDGFIRFMSQYKHEIRLLMKKSEISPSTTVNRQFFVVSLGKEIPLIIVYLSFIKYLKSNLSFAPSSVMDALNSLFYECCHSKLFKNEFVASPLHLNILVDYFHNKIKGCNLSPTTWSKTNESFDMYKHFLETKLIRIRYQDKTQNDMTKPDNILAYKRDFAEFMDKHKKLAAYAMYGECLFDSNGLKQINKMIQEVKEGEERTGIICNVLDDIPIFVHSTLKEYFAVEFICDLLKSEDNQAFLWDYILNEMFFNCNKNVLTTFDYKMKLDEELSIAVKKSHKLIFDLLLKQGRNKSGQIRSALCEAVRHDMTHFVEILFYSVIDVNLDKNNLMDFIKIVKENNMLIVAVKMDLVEPISCIIRAVTKVDKTKLITLFENIKKLDTEDIDSISVSDYIQMIHQYVWTRMDINPDWENLSELSGQIYFI